MIPPPPRSTLFPYTTLFRSVDHGNDGPHLVGGGAHLYACPRSGQPFAPWEGSHCSAWDARRTMGSGSSRSEAGGTRTGAGTARTGEAVVLARGPSGPPLLMPVTQWNSAYECHSERISCPT